MHAYHRRTVFSVIIALTAASIVALASRAGAQASCEGDFNHDGQVTIDEIIVSVNHALSDCPAPGPRFVDNGNGTISDTQSGLQWEKKSDDNSIHDQLTTYTWSANANDMDGTAFTVFLAGLNTSPCFTGHCDWRLPTVSELETLVDATRFAPAIDPAFNHDCTSGCHVETCSCTNIDYAWATPTLADLPDTAWAVDFNYGYANGFLKTIPYGVRAVRQK